MTTITIERPALVSDAGNAHHTRVEPAVVERERAGPGRETALRSAARRRGSP